MTTYSFSLRQDTFFANEFRKVDSHVLLGHCSMQLTNAGGEQSQIILISLVNHVTYNNITNNPYCLC